MMQRYMIVDDMKTHQRAERKRKKRCAAANSRCCEGKTLNWRFDLETAAAEAAYKRATGS